jgi:chromate transporter
LAQDELREAQSRDEPPSETEIFWTFLRVTMFSFGGAAAWVQRVLVDERHWLTDRQFAEELSLCQFLPGPNITNLAVVLGTRFRGGRGALIAVTALILPPAIIVTAVAALYAVVGSSPLVHGTLTGLSAAAAGLFVVLLLRLLGVLWRSFPRESFAFCAISFAAVAFAGIPLAAALFGLAPLSIARAWWRHR